MTEIPAPYESAPVLDRVLEPFEKWADSGYAEGVIDFLPSLGREPLLLSPGSVAAVFEAAMEGLDRENPSEEDKSEAARRFEYIERLLDGLITRENEIRDRYYLARRKGMLHRTFVGLAGIGTLVAASVALPTWGSILISGLLGGAAVVGYHRFSKTAKALRSACLFEERGPRIVRELPWMTSSDDINQAREQ